MDRSHGLKKKFRSQIPHGNFYFFHAHDKTKNISLQLRVNAVVSFALSFALFTFPIAYPFHITLLRPLFFSAKSTECYQYNYGYNTITYFFTLLLVYIMYLFLSSQLKGKKTASLPKMSGKKLITQTEMTCPRDIVEEGECGRDPMKDVESGLSSLHLSPGCEQFYPCIMDELPGDSRI